MYNVIQLAQALIEKPSITPDDADCQVLLLDIFEKLGFTVQHFDCNRVKNLWATYGSQYAQKQPLFVFAGHTDVVPTGDLSLWQSPPFTPQIRDGYLFGRGACDMKGGIAAMVCAVARFLHQQQTQVSTLFKQGGIGFLITSAEEGDDFDDGTPYVMKQLKAMGQIPRYCLVGEPSSTAILGDTIKVGRRGSLTGYLTILGKQGHVAYPQYAENPVHSAAALLNEWVDTVWDTGNAYFSPTSFQITHMHADGGASNVIPGTLQIHFNFRYASVSSHEQLQTRIEASLKKHGFIPEVNMSLRWRHNGLPFLTEQGALLTAAQAAIESICNISPTLSTTGGTSDGRFIAPYGVDVIELGLINKTIHQINESASLDSLQQLSHVYETMLEILFKSSMD